MRIGTFNLGKNIQLNISDGSEKLMVDECKIEYGDSRVCTINAINLLENLDLDIIGLQEVVPDTIKEIKKRRIYSILGDNHVCILYNEQYLGQGYILDKIYLKKNERFRIMLICYFPEINLIFICLHAPHKVNLKEMIEKNINDSLKNFTAPIDRIILVGDHNDGYNKEYLKELNILGFVLKHPKNPIKGCCFDSNYIYQGDYIFDSDIPTKKFYYGTLEEEFELMSDHKPLFYLS